MKRVLLTGAGGFVGHHTLEHLLVNTDWEVVCLDSFRHRGKTDRIREVLDGQRAYNSLPACSPGDAYDRTRVLTHDLRVPISAQLDHEIGPIDYVISMASDSHVDRSCVEPRPFIENNVSLMLTLLEWMRARARPYTSEPGVCLPAAHPAIQKFLHVSTDEVYGPASVGHDHMEGEPHRPSNPYSASKACQEDIVYSYWRTFGLPVAISNTMNIIGERQDPEKFVPLVLAKVLKGDKVSIHASVDEYKRPVSIGSRFYLHARNQADALLFLLNTQTFHRYGDATEVQYETYTDRFEHQMGRFNVVGEREIDNLEMATMIARYAGCGVGDDPRVPRFDLVDFHSSRPGHDLRYALDGTKMTDLGWTPPMPLEESLQKTVEWSLAHPEWLLP